MSGACRPIERGHLGRFARRTLEEVGQSALVVVIVIVLVLSLLVAVLYDQTVNTLPLASQSVLNQVAQQAALAGTTSYQNLVSETPGDASAYCSTYKAIGLAAASGVCTATGTVPGSTVDPAFAAAFPTGSCQSSTSTSGWTQATVSTSSLLSAQYQYVVNSSSLQGNASGGNVVVYATGRAGRSGNWTCRTVKSSIWVQVAQKGVNQNVPTNNTYTSVNTPTGCTTTCTVTTATITVGGGSGGQGDDWPFGGAGGNGGNGEELTTTFVIPLGATLSAETGNQGFQNGSTTTGYGNGGSSGNPGNNSSGAGGGGTAVCLFNASGGTCTASVPPCTTVYTAIGSIPATGCALIIAGGGGGGGQALAVGSGPGNGGQGGKGGPYAAQTFGTATSAEASAQGSPGQAVDGTGTPGGGAWALTNTPTGGAAGTGETFNVFGINGDTTPSGSAGSGTANVGNSGGAGAQYKGCGCFWGYWIAGDGGGGGGGYAGGGGAAAVGNGSGGGGGGGASYFDVAALCDTTTVTAAVAANCPNYVSNTNGAGVNGSGVQIGAARYGPGFANYALKNISSSASIPIRTTSCLTAGGTQSAGGGLGVNPYTPCSPNFDPYGAWYSASATASKYSCMNANNSTGIVACGTYTQLQYCGVPWITEAPSGATQGQVWISGGGGGGSGGHNNDFGGNGASAMVDFTATSGDYYSVVIGCGAGGGTPANTCPQSGFSGYYGHGGAPGGGNMPCNSTAFGGGGGGAGLLCFNGTSTSASCSTSTADCTSSLTSPCIIAEVGGGGGGGTGGGTGGGNATNWCAATPSQNVPSSYCNGYNGVSGGTGGYSWFDVGTGTSGNLVDGFSTTQCTDGSANITSLTGSCIIANDATTYSNAQCTSTSTNPPEQYTVNLEVFNLPSENEAGNGCGGAGASNSGGNSTWGYAGYAGQLGYYAGTYTAYSGWANWIVTTPAIENGACDYTPTSGMTWPPDVATTDEGSVAVPSTGTYTMQIAGAPGAGGWSTAGAGNYGNGGPGTSLTFSVSLTSGEVITAVGGCSGFGNLGGLGFANGGSSGFQPQPTYGSGNSNSGSPNGVANYTPALNGIGGGGGGASALCLSPVGTTTSTVVCTAGEPGKSTTPLCITAVASSLTGTCVLAIAGGGGGAGTTYSSSANSLPVSTGCTAADNYGTGGSGAGTAGTAYSGSWGGTSYASTGQYWSGTTGGGTAATAPGAGGGQGTAAAYPTTSSKGNPDPTTSTGGYVGNGGNGGFAATGYPNTPGAGGGGGGFVGGWADPWNFSGQSVPTDANPASTGGYLSGAGTAAGCGAGGGSSWSLVGTTTSGSNTTGGGSITVLYDPAAASQQTTVNQVPIYSSTT